MFARVGIFQVLLCSFRGKKKKERFIELDGPSSCGCSMCHTVEIKDQRINRVCCVTKLKAFLSFYVRTHRKNTALMKHNFVFPVIFMLGKNECSSVSLLPSKLKLSYRVGFLVGEKRRCLWGFSPPWL